MIGIDFLATYHIFSLSHRFVWNRQRDSTLLIAYTGGNNRRFAFPPPVARACRAKQEVAAKGLELHVEFQGKIYVIKKTGDSLGIFHNKLTASGNT